MFDQAAPVFGLSAITGQSPQPLSRPTGDDVEWFVRHPSRKHRLRWATQDELEHYRDALPTKCPRDAFIAIVVKSYGHGLLAKLPLSRAGELPTGERAARRIADACQTPEHDAQMRALASKVGQIRRARHVA